MVPKNWSLDGDTLKQDTPSAIFIAELGKKGVLACTQKNRTG